MRDGVLGLAQACLLCMLPDGAPAQRPAKETQHGGEEEEEEEEEGVLPVPGRDKGRLCDVTPLTRGRQAVK